MTSSNVLRRSWPFFARCTHVVGNRRGLHNDGRNRLTSFWGPAQPRKPSGDEESHDLLLRAGFLRQAHSGIFHILPLGLRVQDKLERLVDKHMRTLGASKVSLSSLTSEELWRKSGRLEGRGSELFHLKDRRETKYLLSPTHEEEITAGVAGAVQSYKDLPLRLYQVTRKYRDEARPRQGLLRGREFVMKDLYTFDISDRVARDTYEQVKKSYAAFFDDLRIPYLVANADSGDMGGSLSHEYHFVSDKGEDTIISCDECNFSLNEELFIGLYDETTVEERKSSYHLWTGISTDRKSLVQAYYPADGQMLNIDAVKAIFPGLDTGVEDVTALLKMEKILPSDLDLVTFCDPRMKQQNCRVPTIDGKPILLTRARDGDACPSCHKRTIRLQKAIEIGHTFHLGTRYSDPLGAKVLNAENKQVSVSMGCHGLGISRIIGATASLLADDRGLNWPLVIAPFGAVIITTPNISLEDGVEMYDQLSECGLDPILDDREKSIGWKLKDADLIGYPFIVVMGKNWAGERTVEVQCRRLALKEQIHVDNLSRNLAEYSSQL